MLKVDPTPHTVYPSQTITISVVVMDQGFGTVAGSAELQAFLKDENDEHDTTSTGNVFQRRVE